MIKFSYLNRCRREVRKSQPCRSYQVVYTGQNIDKVVEALDDVEHLSGNLLPMAIEGKAILKGWPSYF